MVWWTKLLGSLGRNSPAPSDHSSGRVMTSLSQEYNNAIADESSPSFTQLRITYAAILTNQIQALHALVGVCHRMRTKDLTLFLMRGRVWERDHDWGCIIPIKGISCIVAPCLWWCLQGVGNMSNISEVQCSTCHHCWPYWGITLYDFMIMHFIATCYLQFGPCRINRVTEGKPMV